MELPDSTGFHLEYKFPFFSSAGPLQNFLRSLRKSTIGKEENLFFYLGSRFVLGIPFPPLWDDGAPWGIGFPVSTPLFPIVPPPGRSSKSGQVDY